MPSRSLISVGYDGTLYDCDFNQMLGWSVNHGVPTATAYCDLVHKKSVYKATGVREYWIVDPKEKSIEIFVNGPDGFHSVAKATGQGTVHSSIIDRFVITLGEVFEGL